MTVPEKPPQEQKIACISYSFLLLTLQKNASSLNHTAYVRGQCEFCL
jgi:hypothetical protein